MAERVVEALEAIEVEHDQRKRAPGSLADARARGRTPPRRARRFRTPVSGSVRAAVSSRRVARDCAEPGHDEVATSAVPADHRQLQADRRRPRVRDPRRRCRATIANAPWAIVSLAIEEAARRRSPPRRGRARTRTRPRGRRRRSRPPTRIVPSPGLRSETTIGRRSKPIRSSAATAIAAAGSPRARPRPSQRRPAAASVEQQQHGPGNRTGMRACERSSRVGGEAESDRPGSANRAVRATDENDA